LDLTQEKLAEKADVHHNFIGEVERGNMNCSLDSLVKIAKAARLFSEPPLPLQRMRLYAGPHLTALNREMILPM
jgi:predicted transcriptional regulator